ncbi:MAG TPA: MFS transporter [Conexibacter sp.]|nr:MFS transporter [Conexibacter sp.]
MIAGAATDAASRYRSVLGIRHARSLVGAGVLGRLPAATEALAMLLLVRERSGSFAVAGAVSGGFALAVGVSFPLQGRLLDRLGHARVLNPLSVLHVLALGLFVAAAYGGVAPAVLVASAATVGAMTPAVQAAQRSVWRTLLGEDQTSLATAYAIDALLSEIAFVLGPLVAASCAALGAPVAALAFGGVGTLVGTRWFTALPPSRTWRPGSREPGSRRAPIAVAGVRTVALGALPLGMAFGAVEVALAAYGRAHGSANLGGVLIATISCGSIAGGLLYGALARGGGAVRRYVGLLVALPFTLGILAISSAVWLMLLLSLPAGMAISPLVAAENETLNLVAPANSGIEAYAWIVTMMVVGGALGSAAAGALVEADGWRVTMVVACAVSTAGALLVLMRRRTLVPATA